jgi:hypothetical protein
MDVADRQVQVKLRNESDRDVVVERMILVSSAFDAPMVYRKSGSHLDAGRAVDMPVVLSAPVCDSAAGEHTVRVDYRLGDGTTGTVEVDAADDRGAVADLHAAECFVLDVNEVAALSFRGEPRVVLRGGSLTADLTVDVTAVDASGDAGLQVLRMGNTTLLQHLDAATLAPLPEGLPLDVRAPDAGTVSFTATLVPGRCDPHAVAEDKQGTRFPVLVDLDGRQGLVPVPAPEPLKVALYDFVRDACSGRHGAATPPGQVRVPSDHRA